MVGRKSRLEAAKRLGADEVVDLKEEPIEAVRAITGGRGVMRLLKAAARLAHRSRQLHGEKGGKVSLLGAF